ncbi:potassium channel subfamily K member 6-like isoform X1 [Artemia franciscana]|uniref:Potassium channel domain-containing protein n=2 Tax=Artemia franciscana TaxID=6661 RepID=A0AA88H4V5_ARTSF|nr:hypothetical protein QYM36_018222 [Artemia franciscana]
MTKFLKMDSSDHLPVVPSLPNIPKWKSNRMKVPHLGRRNISVSNLPSPLVYLRKPPKPLRLFWNKIRRSSLLLTIYLVVYIGYLSVGALVLSYIETPSEINSRIIFRKMIQEFKERNPSISEDDLEQLIVNVVLAGARGVPVTRNATGDSNWNFGQAFFFAGTVVTTIGYGHVTPSTEAGKMFTMIYGIVGIPMTLIFFTSLVDRLMVPTTALLHYLARRLRRHNHFRVQCIHLTISFLTLLGFFFCLPAAIFNYLEDGWGYLDSLYYCFISLTTVGLGDYIPGDSPYQQYRSLYKILTTIYLLFGLVVMVLILNIFYEIPELNFGNMFLLKSDEYIPKDDTEGRFLISNRRRSYGTSDTTQHPPTNTSDDSRGSYEA